MKATLTKLNTSQIYHYANGAHVDGPCPGLRGDCTGLRGDCTGLRGNLNDCEITAAERVRGVYLDDLIGPTK